MEDTEDTERGEPEEWDSGVLPERAEPSIVRIPVDPTVIAPPPLAE